MAKADLSAQRLRELLDYNAESGVFTWRVRPSQSVFPGRVAGTDNGAGYLTIKVFGRHHKAHRLAWLHQTGAWPQGDIDHINGVKADNRFANLRDVPTATNCQNVYGPRSSNKSSGLLGATWSKAAKKWAAAICVNGKKTHLGTFDTAEDAHMAYLCAKRLRHAGNML